MIVETLLFKEACSKILQAVSKSELTPITETLELKTAASKVLMLNVTNREYFVSVKFPIEMEEDFHATVNAATFLKLVGQITSDTIELKCTEQYLSIKANGSYRVPLIFEADKLLDLPEITIDNCLSTFNIDTSVLKSILKYNSRRTAKKVYAQEIQATYYVDQEGCITFSKGACVNAFTLAQPVKFLLSETVVKLLKLFQTPQVSFSLGVDPLGNVMQTKVSFANDQITLTAITPNLNIENMPVAAVRASAKNRYTNSIVLNREALAQALNRLMILSGEKNWVYGSFTLMADEVLLEDLQKNNSEILKYQNGSYQQSGYTFVLELKDLKQLVSDWTEEYITLCCGVNHMVAIKRGSVTDVLPEVVINTES